MDPLATGRNSHLSSRVTINVFPVEILLEIFDFCRAAAAWSYRGPQSWPGGWPGTWRRLIHVCQRWRYVVLSSPLRLDLYLDCLDSSPVSEMLDVWPPFPIQVTSWGLGDNTIAALEHRDRVSQIRLWLTCLECKKLAAVIQEPLPALTSLSLSRMRGPADDYYEGIPALPTTFLGGSAPRLQSLSLKGVPFPTLPQLLLSCSDLSELSLRNVSNLDYISPEAMATSLSALTRLTYLCIEFDGKFRPDQVTQHSPLFTRAVTAVLPSLKELDFKGFSEYLEDLLARIDVPQLVVFWITFFQQDVFDIRQVVSHSRTLGPFNCAEVTFKLFSVSIKLYQPEGTKPIKMLGLGIHGGDSLGWKVSSMTQIGTQSSDLLSSVRELDILSGPLFDANEVLNEVLKHNTEWLELFHTFSAVRTLRFSGERGSHVVSSLQELTGESTMVLPNLQNVYFPYSGNEFQQQLMELFFAPSDHPVTLPGHSA